MQARFRHTAFAAVATCSTLLAAGCGQPAPAPSQTKVVNGEAVESGDPLTGSTVALVTLFGGQQFCTGTLVDKRHIITAAHCKEGVGLGFLAVFGPVAKVGVTPVDHAVIGASFHANEGFSLEGAARGLGEPVNDIGFVTLSADAPADATPVPYLSRDDSLKAGEAVTVAGFGLTSGNAVGTNGVLRKTQSKITELSDNGKEFALGNSTGRACNGDSGGPAYVVRNGQLVLAGVVSRGEAGCGGIVIYTDVRYFIDWINQA